MTAGNRASKSLLHYIIVVVVVDLLWESHVMCCEWIRQKRQGSQSAYEYSIIAADRTQLDSTCTFLGVASGLIKTSSKVCVSGWLAELRIQVEYRHLMLPNVAVISIFLN